MQYNVKEKSTKQDKSIAEKYSNQALQTWKKNLVYTFQLSKPRNKISRIASNICLINNQL